MTSLWRSLLIVLCFVVMGCIGLFTLTTSSIMAQGTNRDLYISVDVGQGSLDYITGYKLNEYGDISPNGFVEDLYSGSLSYIYWNDRANRFYVRLTAVPPNPLDSIEVEFGDPYDCLVSGETRVYVCRYDPSADSDEIEIETPWNDGDSHTVRLRFQPPLTPTPGPTPDGTQVAFPDPESCGSLPPRFGSEYIDRSIALDLANDHGPAFVFVDGFLHVHDYSDNMVYAYNVETGARDTTREFLVQDSPHSPFTLAYAGGKFWVIRSPNDASAPYTQASASTYEITSTSATGAVVQVGTVSLDDTSVRQWIAYKVETVVDSGGKEQLLISYSTLDGGFARRHFGMWNLDGTHVHSSPHVGLTPDLDDVPYYSINDDGTILWVGVTDDVVDPSDGVRRYGAAAYDFQFLMGQGDYVRQEIYDISTGTDASFGLEFHDNILYMSHAKTVGEWVVYAYNANTGLVYDESGTLAQNPPIIESLSLIHISEPTRPY